AAHRHGRTAPAAHPPAHRAVSRPLQETRSGGAAVRRPQDVLRSDAAPGARTREGAASRRPHDPRSPLASALARAARRLGSLNQRRLGSPTYWTGTPKPGRATTGANSLTDSLTAA